MIETVILDFDGTIGDTRSLIVRTMQDTIAKLGLPARTDDECAAMIGLPLRQTFTDLIPMSEEMGALCDKTYSELFFQNNKPGAVSMFPHVKETIREMYAMGITVTIASSRRRDTLLEYLKVMGLENYISFIVSASDVTNAKPAPDMVYSIMSHTNFEPTKVLVVGDSKYDIQMGKAVGVRTCGVTYGNGTLEELQDADYIINDFRKLLEIV